MGQADEDFMCPISMAIMEDPVILADSGITYERAEISAWLAKGKNNCPCTGVELKDATLIPNRALKSAIEKWKLQGSHEDTSPPSPPVSKSAVRSWLTIFCPCLKPMTITRSPIHHPQNHPTSRADANRLTAAVRNQNFDVLQSLHVGGCRLDVLDDAGRSPLHWATIQNRLQLVDVLLGYGVDPDYPDKSGCTALHWAARLGHTECLRQLVKSGAAVNATNVSGMTPVHMAAYFGRVEVLMVLIDSGGDMDAVNERGQRPIDVAKESPMKAARQTMEVLRNGERTRPRAELT